MPNSIDTSRNAATNAAANVKVHHARLDDIKTFTPEKVNHLQRGGIREGAGRDVGEMQQMLDKIPPSQRAGQDGQSAAQQVKDYLADKDASHIEPHSHGGSSHPDNIKWEPKSANRARGNQTMTQQEQLGLDLKAQFDNLAGAAKAGIGAMPKGAAIGAATTIPFALLRNGLRVVRGEISAQEAAIATAKDTAIGGGVGAVTAFSVTAVAVACPPIAIALTAISPALLVVGGAGMVQQFFSILGSHKQQVQDYYNSMTQQQLDYLQHTESELIYEHEKALANIERSREFTHEIVNRPRETGVEGALKRYLESTQMLQEHTQSSFLAGAPASEHNMLPAAE